MVRARTDGRRLATAWHRPGGGRHGTSPGALRGCPGTRLVDPSGRDRDALRRRDHTPGAEAHRRARTALADRARTSPGHVHAPGRSGGAARAHRRRLGVLASYQYLADSPPRLRNRRVGCGDGGLGALSRADDRTTATEIYPAG